jgi:Zinc finger, C3HC4 type (RING finger)
MDSILPPPMLARQKEPFMEQVMMCTLCQEIPLDPVLTPCNHMFCRHCILEALRFRDECPNDRHPLTKEMLQPIEGIARCLWEKIGVMCPTPNCLWTGTVGNYGSHIIRCRNNDRSDKITIADYDSKITEIQKSHELELKELEASYEAALEALQEAHRRNMDEALTKQKKKFMNVAQMYQTNQANLMQAEACADELQEAISEFESFYECDRTKIVPLTKLICRHLIDPPDSIDRNKIFQSIEKLIHDAKQNWDDNPRNFKVHVRMLISVCLASAWFIDPQKELIERMWSGR